MNTPNNNIVFLVYHKELIDADYVTPSFLITTSSKNHKKLISLCGFVFDHNPALGWTSRPKEKSSARRLTGHRSLYVPNVPHWSDVHLEPGQCFASKLSCSVYCTCLSGPTTSEWSSFEWPPSLLRSDPQPQFPRPKKGPLIFIKTWLFHYRYNSL